MLRARGIPTFIFVNKVDISDRRSKELLSELKISLSGGCISFTSEGSEEFYEEVAGRDTALMFIAK
jgi:peptide subunit release factor RF-3